MIAAALSALLLAAPVPARTPAAEPAARVGWALHGSVGTGFCTRPYSDTEVSANPCYLEFGALGAVRYKLLEAGLSWEGRQPLDVLTLFKVRPPTATVLGLSAGLTSDQWDRWRLSAAGEVGWRRYTNFAGSGPTDWYGTIDTAYAGLVGRAATGMKNAAGRTDRIEVTVAWRYDLQDVTKLVGGVPWHAGGWSFTMGVGLVADW
jgi:hypothetical protein